VGERKIEKRPGRKKAVLQAFVATLVPLSDLKMEAEDAYLDSVGRSAGNQRNHLSAIAVWVT